MMPAPAQTYVSLVALTEGARPRGVPPARQPAPIRPIGCMRGLGSVPGGSPDMEHDMLKSLKLHEPARVHANPLRDLL
jgi:hypothetical protein